MSNVVQLFSWPIHLSDPNDEWEALCGHPSPEILVEDDTGLLPGYRTCEACAAARASTPSSATD